MSALRDEIRSILLEEMGSLRHLASDSMKEAVQVTNDADLMRFACDLVSRASDPQFVKDVTTGKMRFQLAQATLTAGGGEPRLPSNVQLSKSLLTEKDIAAVSNQQRVVRVRKDARLTPLAQDEARRRGLRIERSTS